MHMFEFLLLEHAGYLKIYFLYRLRSHFSSGKVCWCTSRIWTHKPRIGSPTLLFITNGCNSIHIQSLHQPFLFCIVFCSMNLSKTMVRKWYHHLPTKCVWRINVLKQIQLDSSRNHDNVFRPLSGVILYCNCIIRLAVATREHYPPTVSYWL